MSKSLRDKVKYSVYSKVDLNQFVDIKLSDFSIKISSKVSDQLLFQVLKRVMNQLYQE